MNQGDKNQRHLRVLTSDGRAKIKNNVTVCPYTVEGKLESVIYLNRKVEIEDSDFEQEQRAKT